MPHSPAPTWQCVNRRHFSAKRGWMCGSSPRMTFDLIDTPKGSSVSRHIVCLTFDFDTMSGFIARGLMTPTPLSRGEFGRRASPRIWAFLQSRGIRSTWFTPGFTVETWPRECEAVVKAGHEIAHHSWAHVPPANQSREEEEADMVRANDAV